MPTHQKHRLTKPASEHRSLDHRLRNAVEVDRDAAKQANQVVKSAAIGAITATVSQNTAPRVGVPTSVPTSVPDVRDIRCHRQPVQKSPDCESNEQPNEELGHRHTCVDSDISSDSKQDKTQAAREAKKVAASLRSSPTRPSQTDSHVQLTSDGPATNDALALLSPSAPHNTRTLHRFGPRSQNRRRETEYVASPLTHGVASFRVRRGRVARS
jgi:hypothetical protein